jgi:hypothetical protein
MLYTLFLRKLSSNEVEDKQRDNREDPNNAGRGKETDTDNAGGMASAKALGGEDIEHQESTSEGENKQRDNRESSKESSSEGEDKQRDNNESVGSESPKMSWDQVMDKEVKTSDKKELGKIKSVGDYFVEVEDGVIRKKHYFVPKKYLHEYDGDTVYASLDKDQINQKYQRDSPPLESEVEEIEKDKEYELIPFMAKEPGLEIQTPSMNSGLKIPWEEVIHKHVRTTDNLDLGDVDRIGDEFIVVREGVVKIHLYYIPKKYIIKYDGSTLWLNLSSTVASSKFERENEPTKEEMEMILNS